MDKLRQTPTQTIGPFFAYGLTAEQYGYHFNSLLTGEMVDGEYEGTAIVIHGKIYDGSGSPINDAMIELCQADKNGSYIKTFVSEGFKGFGRLGTGTKEDFSFNFKTIKPGIIEGQAPHINVILFMRGSLHHLYTRIYFDDEAKLNENDSILNSISPERRQTLIAKKKEDDGLVSYHFDIHMQGNQETVFFEI